MTHFRTAVFIGLVLVSSLAPSGDAAAFCYFSTDCPGGAATYEPEPLVCKSDFDCPSGQHCDTATGACFTPSSASACYCPDDGDACTTDEGVLSATGGCFCVHNPIPGCREETGTPIGSLIPTYRIRPELIGKPAPEPIDPGTGAPDPVKPLDPEPLPTPPLPPAVTPCDAYPAAYRDCCLEAEADPALMLDLCVSDGEAEAACSNVVTVMAAKDATVSLTDFNQCCQAVNNKGTIASSEIEQACKNIGKDSPEADPAGKPESAGEGTPEASKDFFHVQGGGAPGGCSLIR